MVKTKERHYAIWRTLKLGTYKSAEDLSLALTEARFRIGGYAAQILKEVVAATATIFCSQNRVHLTKES